MKNLYIHVPFCASNCSYCTFAKHISLSKELHRSYFHMLEQEIQASSFIQAGEKIGTLYFGGGTPSLIAEDILMDFFAFLHTQFSFSPDTEITFETHPATVTKEKIAAWKKLGINRISLGVQTFQKKYDRFLERNLSATIKALELLKKSNVALSCDLIFGFPSQTQEDLLVDLQMIKEFQIDHVSYYALDYKPHSKIEKDFDESLPFEDYCKLYDVLCEFLVSQGYDHYEIFNFSKNRHYSQHNINFWNQQDYIGFGLSAVSGVGGLVQENTSDLLKYLKGDFVTSSYELTEEEQLELYLKKALRLKEGVDISDFQRRFPEQSASVLGQAKTISSWLSMDAECFALTQEGKMNFSDVLEVLV